MGSAHIAYSQRPDVRAEAEVSALVSVYKLAISSQEQKEAAAENRPDDAERDLLSDSAKNIIQESK